MLTIFAIPKAFTGRFALIQKNAIQSWLNLSPVPEIILFGDEKGTAEICTELRLKHIPEVKKNEFGTPLVSDLFEQAQQHSYNQVMCYSNCDIIFRDDFYSSIIKLNEWKHRFLMVGRRVDLDIDYEINFKDIDDLERLSKRVETEGKIKPPNWIDYFIFCKGTIMNILPFGVGRPGWDNWLLWYSSNMLGLKVVDATGSITAIHQNHDYSHHTDGYKGIWESEEADKSYAMVGGANNFYFISNSAYRLKDGKVVRNITTEHIMRLYTMKVKLRIRHFWFYLLEITRPLRHKLGIRKTEVNRKVV